MNYSGGSEIGPDSAHAVTARRILASALHMNVDDVECDAAIGRTERWDSPAHTNLILALEQHLGRQLDTDTMPAIERLADITALLSSSD